MAYDVMKWVLAHPGPTEALLVGTTLLVALLALRTLVAATLKLFAFLAVLGLALAVAASSYIYLKGRTETRTRVWRATVRGKRCRVELAWRHLPVEDLPGGLGRRAARSRLPAVCTIFVDCPGRRLRARTHECSYRPAEEVLSARCRGCGEVEELDLDTGRARLFVRAGEWSARLRLVQSTAKGPRGAASRHGGSRKAP